MPGLLKLCNAVHWLALTLWVGALLTAGIAAMNVFPTLSGMDMSLPRYAALPAQEHGRLAAGMVMEGVFFTVDLIQFVAVPLAVLTLLIQFGLFRIPFRAPSNLVRCACIVGAAAIFAFHATMLAPKMNRELRAYWNAVEANDLPLAQGHLAEFQRKHPVANTLLQTNLVLLLIGVASTAVALSPVRQREHTHIPSLLRMR